MNPKHTHKKKKLEEKGKKQADLMTTFSLQASTNWRELDLETT